MFSSAAESPSIGKSTAPRARCRRSAPERASGVCGYSPPPSDPQRTHETPSGRPCHASPLPFAALKGVVSVRPYSALRDTAAALGRPSQKEAPDEAHRREREETPVPASWRDVVLG